MPKPLIRCRFCDVDAEEHPEDVLSRWRARYLRRGPKDQWYAGQDVFSASGPTRFVRRRPSQTAAVWKLDRVCKDCNRGWMSTIEDRAKPRLLAMSQGRSVLLTPRDRIHLARWAQLKWLCFDALSAEPLIAPDVAHALHEAAEPLPHISVSVAPLGELPPDESRPQPAFIWAERVSGRKVRHDLVHVTLVLDSLAMFVIGPAALAPAVATRRLVGPWFVEWWPENSAENVRWNVTAPIPRRVFSAFALGPSP